MTVGITPLLKEEIKLLKKIYLGIIMGFSGFFNRVDYQPNQIDNGWLSKFETAADICRTPSQWIATELWNGGRRYELLVGGAYEDVVGVYVAKSPLPQSEGIKKVICIAFGIILAIPGQLLAIPLMGIAFTSEEIRLKHKASSVAQLADDEETKLQDLIEERRNSKIQRFNPFSFFLQS